jgi:hypothetical protein
MRSRPSGLRHGSITTTELVEQLRDVGVRDATRW